MKKIRIIPIAMLLGVAISVSAQNQDDKKPTFDKKVSDFWKKTKKELEQAGHQLGDAIGFEDRIDRRADLRKVNGTFYMPLYSKDLYKGDSSLTFRTACTQLFRKKYPKANIMSVAIPQTDWVVEPVKKSGSVVGYQKTLHCFIIARDGEEGYINAKFTYAQYKDAGHDYQKIKKMWPQWTRTDVMSNSVYNELKE